MILANISSYPYISSPELIKRSLGCKENVDSYWVCEHIVYSLHKYLTNATMY